MSIRCILTYAFLSDPSRSAVTYMSVTGRSAGTYMSDPSRLGSGVCSRPRAEMFLSNDPSSLGTLKQKTCGNEHN